VTATTATDVAALQSSETGFFAIIFAARECILMRYAQPSDAEASLI
jgi:hypothetical protein